MVAGTKEVAQREPRHGARRKSLDAMDFSEAPFRMTVSRGEAEASNNIPLVEIGEPRQDPSACVRPGPEQRLAVQGAVALALAESSTLEQAAPGLLRAVCECLAWPVAGLWQVEPEQGVLRCIAVWHAPSVNIPRLKAASRESTFARGVGMLGRVWATGKALWVPDVALDSNFPRAAIAEAEGLHAAVAFPVLCGGEVLGVVDFFSHEVHEPDDDLLQMMTAVGAQIGRFIERQRALEGLQENQKRLSYALNATAEGVWDWNIKTGVVRFSRRWIESLGYTPEEVPEHVSFWESLVHPDDLPRVRALMEEHFTGRTPLYICENRLRKKSGEYRWNLDRGQVVERDADAQPLRMVGTDSDITERRLSEAALRESEQQLRLAIEAGRMGTWEWDMATNQVLWSPALEAIHGLAPGSFPGTFEAYQHDIHPEDRQRVLETIGHTVETGNDHHIEYRIVWPDGSIHWVEGRGKLFHDAAGVPTRMMGVCVDITQRKQAEEALRERAHEIETLLETLPIGVFFAHDPECRRITGNRAGHELLRTPVEQNLSKTAPPGDLPVHFRVCRNGVELPPDELPVQRAARGEHVRNEVVEIVFEGGEVSHQLLSAAPLVDVTGRVRGAVASVLDVTDRRRAEERLRFVSEASRVLAASLDYAATLKSLAELAVPALADWCTVDLLHDDDTIERVAVVHTDPAKVELGHQLLRRYPLRLDMPEGIVLRSGQSLLYPEITDEMLAAYARDGEHLKTLRELGLKSTMVVPLAARGRVLGAISLVSAESGRRYDESDLSVADDLARRAAVAIENARLYQELREADRRKDEFLATLAHELRNPLAPICNAIELMKHAGDAAVLDQARSMMERQVRQMVRLVDDLLDVSRITKGKVHLRMERIDLSIAVHSALEATWPFIEARRHELAVSLPDEPIYLSADLTRLSQVIANLLHNAAKYTEKGGRIWLAARRDGQQAVVSVRDTGIGIAAEHLPHLFEMFSQVEPALERSAGGLGIGLALVQGLVSLHGGSVEARSDGIGQGSEFIVRLPAEAGHEARVGTERPSTTGASNGRRHRILVVDDNRDSVQSLAMLLRIKGNEVATAYDGLEAVQTAAAFRPDVVLLDLGLPKMNGYEAARHIRAQPWGCGMALVALSGWGQEEDKRRALEAGFDQHLTKPVEARSLDKLLSALVTSQEA
jgi:PAS domain S-box-containing protein